MARIRTIKPEFPQSEDVGRLSRDARLLFVQLWTIVDDEGRARAASRMLASLLYPYDDDAPSLIDGWLLELEHAGLIRRYEFAGSQYLDVLNWLKHQKIDKPTKSKLPAFDEALATPREFSSSPREPSATDLGPRTLDLGEEKIQPPADDASTPSIDPRTRLFRHGLTILVRITGNGTATCRALIGKWLKASGDDAALVLEAIEDAERERIASPQGWIAARLSSSTGPPGVRPRPGSKDDLRERTANVLTKLGEFAASEPDGEGKSRPGRPPVAGVLPFPAAQ